ncbi:hypothetical protein ES731_08405 [Psychroflexus gondwanensis]|uniref:PKD/Chitinase domain-containing protein n=2 Tax=Psychroflexus TaxID=83612 RepID=N1WTW0_9FLAO|nr:MULTISPECIES: hypothetical protein [Psychroflexus]EMY80637.1 hypothetical protein pgond44_10839 [Psychroflexus gondwanensis ACAM 44]MBZ9618885.1 hypothetical protein [Psychroflexus lacisalsi]TXE19228.1 hypothetical protein ES731_08405 [Psychroflexus gondwanensis]
MKKQFLILYLLMIAVFTVSCSDDEGLQDIPIGAPSNIDAKISFTQDNSGLVTILPKAENVNLFYADFGDGSELSDTISVGESLSHIYAEGTFDLTLVAMNAADKQTESVQPIEVSFNAPENLEVTIENDGVESNTVNVSVTADFATSFEVDFGEEGVESVVSGSIEETLSYTYQQSGAYTISVEVMGAASQTTTYVEEDFFVEEILVPVVAAPRPAEPSPNVIAIYSDRYTPITVTELPTEWSDTNFEEVIIEGDNTIKYSNLAFTGIVTDYGNPTDLTDMDYVHFDYWTPDASALGFKLVNTVIGEEDIEFVEPITSGQWVSVKFPLADYAMDRSQVTQLLFDTAGNPATVYIDNLYFSKDVAQQPTASAPVPTQDASNVISIYSDAYTSITVSELPTVWSGSGYEEVAVDGNNAMLFTNFDFLGIVTDYGNPTDLTSMTHVHFDYWSPNAESLGLKLVNTALDPVQEDLANAGALTLGEWVSVDIPLADFDMDLSAVTQLIFDNLVEADADDTVYIDNFYFYN